MNIFYRNSVKKQILTNINDATKLYEQIKKCLIPANNIYWCHNLQLQKEGDDDVLLHNFNKNMPSFVVYLEDFCSIYHANDKLCLDYPKLKEFSDDFFVKRLNSLYSQITGTIESIKNISYYKMNSELKKTVKLLEKATINVKTHLDYITKIQAEECSIK